MKNLLLSMVFVSLSLSSQEIVKNLQAPGELIDNNKKAQKKQLQLIVTQMGFLII